MFVSLESAELYEAQMVAAFLHAAQKYDDQDYIFHIENVVNVLERFGIIDRDLVIAAYLHDTVEDTQASFKLIEKYFGEEVMHLVNAVTNEQGVNRKERNLKTYQKLSKNPKAILVKLADRIANVEQAIEKKNESFIKMYRKEFPAFKYALYEVSDPRAYKMWEHLEKLLGE